MKIDMGVCERKELQMRYYTNHIKSYFRCRIQLIFDNNNIMCKNISIFKLEFMEEYKVEIHIPY